MSMFFAIFRPLTCNKTSPRIGFRNEFLTFKSENEVDIDELHILKITFRNGLEIGMGNFPQHFLQEFPARFSCKIFPSWILIGWLLITLFQMLNFHQSLPFLNLLFPLLLVPQEFPTRISHKIFPQDFPARFSRAGS